LTQGIPSYMIEREEVAKGRIGLVKITPVSQSLANGSAAKGRLGFYSSIRRKGRKGPVKNEGTIPANAKRRTAGKSGRKSRTGRGVHNEKYFHPQFRMHRRAIRDQA